MKHKNFCQVFIDLIVGLKHIFCFKFFSVFSAFLCIQEMAYSYRVTPIREAVGMS